MHLSESWPLLVLDCFVEIWETCEIFLIKWFVAPLGKSCPYTYGLTNDQSTDWLTDWLNDWLNDWLTDWLTDWLATYLSTYSLWLLFNSIKYVLYGNWFSSISMNLRRCYYLLVRYWCCNQSSVILKFYYTRFYTSTYSSINETPQL